MRARKALINSLLRLFFYALFLGLNYGVFFAGGNSGHTAFGWERLDLGQPAGEYRCALADLFWGQRLNFLSALVTGRYRPIEPVRLKALQLAPAGSEGLFGFFCAPKGFAPLIFSSARIDRTAAKNMGAKSG